MKKTNNKGFSLVELIIVIAIMAILAGAIAPALIRYIDKSRRSNDVTACKTIKTAVETALGNESVYELITTGDDFCYIYVAPGVKTAVTDETKTLPEDYPISMDGYNTTGDANDEGKINGKAIEDIYYTACSEIGVNIGEKTPKLKFRKNAADKDADEIPTGFVAVVSKKGTVYVYIAVTDDLTGFTIGEGEDADPDDVDSTVGFQICPVTCDEYQ